MNCKYCNRLLASSRCPFSAAALNSSPCTPRSAHFVHFSYRFRRLYCSMVSALWSGHHITGYSAMIPVRSERICSIQRALKCARCEFKLYLFTEVYYFTLRASLVSFACVWRRCTAQIREWMFQSEVNFNGFPLLREYTVKGPCNNLEAWDLFKIAFIYNRPCQSEHNSFPELTSNKLVCQRETCKICRAGVHEDWNWEPLL